MHNQSKPDSSYGKTGLNGNWSRTQLAQTCEGLGTEFLLQFFIQKHRQHTPANSTGKGLNHTNHSSSTALAQLLEGVVHEICSLQGLQDQLLDLLPRQLLQICQVDTQHATQLAHLSHQGSIGGLP